mmetsp:Transcript_62838/g.99694  ORF Transcript_62838/g.99694 Transcript_62838/m.99694 type:complete len:352 (-) Transcript_62838:9-1064(-)
MFFGHHLKIGSRLDLHGESKCGSGVLCLTSACLSDAATSRSATLFLHTPEGQKLAVARLIPSASFARLDLQLEKKGYALEADGAELDVLGFAESPGEEEKSEVEEKSKASITETPRKSPQMKAVETPAVAAETPKKSPQMKAKDQPKNGVTSDKDQKAEGKKVSSPAPVKKPEEATKSEEKTEPPKIEDFIAAKKFAGAKPGMVFKKGKQGVGYYKDTYVAPAGTKRKAETSPAQASTAKKIMTLQGGLKYEVTKSGRGGAPTASRGQKVQVRYEGRLAANGKRFDKGTIRFKLGAGEVIRGWDLGVSGMVVGESRKLLIPPKLGYGGSGAPPDIPPNATLAFDVELLRIN